MAPLRAIWLLVVLDDDTKKSCRAITPSARLSTSAPAPPRLGPAFWLPRQLSSAWTSTNDWRCLEFTEAG